MKNLDYGVFWERLHERAGREHIPLRVMLETTYACNFRCGHCYVPPSYKAHYQKKEMTTQEVFSVIEALKDAGCLYLGFTGGEPFLRKDFFKILWHAKKHGFEIIIYTNGYFIDKKAARELVRLSPNKVDITLPAMSAAAFLKITGLPAARQRVLRAIDFLREAGVNVGLKSCLLKDNAGEMKRIKAYAASKNILHRLDDTLMPRLDGDQGPYRYRASSDGSGASCRAPEDRVGGRDDFFACGAGLRQAAITPAGELKMCVAFDFPKFDILESGFAPCWKKMVVLTRRLERDARRLGRDDGDSCPAISRLKNKASFYAGALS